MHRKSKEKKAEGLPSKPLSEYAVEMRHISKSFPGIKANDDINLALKRGEIHALLGENGAGKSTLMSILFGLYSPDEGEIFVNGEKASIRDPNDATRLGIGMVHQHFMLIDCFTGLENIILGAEPTDKAGVLRLKKARPAIEALCKQYDFKVDLDETVEEMSVGMQQKVEILKMLYREADILILDEPTAVLTPQEIDELMASMRSLAKEGKSILFISHKLNEIMAVADRVTVLRKGKCIGTVNVKDTNVQELSNMMVGRPVQLVVEKKEATPGKPIVSVRHLNVYNRERRKMMVNDVSFDCRAGEITCIAGIEGNGQTDLIYALTGLENPSGGHIYLRNIDISKARGRHSRRGAAETIGTIEITHASIKKRNTLAVSHIPEDRHRYGLILDMPLMNNMVLERYCDAPFSKAGWMNYAAVKKYSDEVIEKFDVRSGQGSNSLTRSMSGGNQQKAIVGREMDRNKPLLIACQPTRGLDVGAIEFIHKEIVRMRDEGRAVLLMSMELDEVMNLADRILVMFNGRIVCDVRPKDTSFQELGLYMAGAKRMVFSDPDEISPAEDTGDSPEREMLEIKEGASEEDAKAEAENPKGAKPKKRRGLRGLFKKKQGKDDASASERKEGE